MADTCKYSFNELHHIPRTYNIVQGSMLLRLVMYNSFPIRNSQS